MSGQIPSQRQTSFALVAETSKSERVLIVCRSRTIRRQYERAIAVRGGNLANVIFRIPSPVISEKRTLS
ncbi:MAG: hypothetical protein ACLQUT_11555 [Thermoleophilia bacterium]